MDGLIASLSPGHVTVGGEIVATANRARDGSDGRGIMFVAASFFERMDVERELIITEDIS